MSTSTEGPGPCCPPDCPCCSGNSGNPIRFFSGRVLLRETDVEAGIPGFNHSRIFYNRNFELVDWDSPQGWNWAVNEWPYIVKRLHTFPGGEQETIVLKDGLYPLWFDLQEDDSFAARYGAEDRNTLEHIPADGIYRFRAVTNGSIQTLDFHDFAQTPDRAGMLKRRVDVNGFETTVTAYGDKTIIGLQTIRGDTTFRLLYSYFGSGDFEGKIETVTLESEADSVTIPLRRVRYLYYDGTTTEGNLGDLKAAIVQQPADGSAEWEDIEVRYYRYTTSGKHLLSYVVGPTVYLKLKEFGQDVLTMPASSGGPDLVPQFCNHQFEYDSVNRVIREVARGTTESTGPEGVSYIRSRNPNVPHNQHTPRTQAEFNTWAWKIVEEGRTGYRTIVYTNKIGQPLATVKQSLADPVRQWITAIRRGADSGTILEATPAAVARIDEMLPDLIGYREVDGSFANLRADAGLITRTEYYADTTASSTTPGGVRGYAKSTAIQQGWQGALIPQSFSSYIASDNSTGPVTYMPAEETTYRFDEDTADSRITLSYAYTWFAPAGEVPPRVQEKTATYPPIPAAEGGDNIAHTTRELYDESGNILWEMDQRGVITKYEYDFPRGLRIREVRDAGTGPSGWTVLPGPHAEQTTDYAYDGLSRLVRTLGPEHQAMVGSSAEMLRPAEFVCYIDAPLSGQSLFGFPVWNQIRKADGYRLSGTGEEAIINPVHIDLKDKCGRIVHAISSKRTTGSGTLAPSDTFLRCDWSRWTSNSYEQRGLLSAVRVYHQIPSASSGLGGVFEILGTEGENYDETRYRYAVESPIRVSQRDPGGTFTCTLYDEIERLVATYVGTRETPDCSSEPWFPGAPGTNLVLVSSREYDLGLSGGNSDLTLLVNHVAADHARLTKYVYDFRGRPVAVDEEESRYSENAYDNLNQVVEIRLRKGSAAGTLISLEKTFLNKLSQPYEVRIYDVDPLSGEAGEYLVGRRLYDPSGNLLESTEPGRGGLATWRTFDYLGRETETAVGCTIPDGMGEVDLAVEKETTTYDAASNLIQVSTDQLNAGASPSSPTYRANYTQSWFDPLGRKVASASLGSLVSPPIRPANPPARSDTILVSETIYNDRAEVEAQIDPLGRENRFSYDDKGRRTALVENYVSPGEPSRPDTGKNRTQRFAYTPDDFLAQLSVLGFYGPDDIPMPQITRWEYGVTLGEALVASNRLLARKVYADGTGDSFSYNRQGEAILGTDANGTIHRLIYDGLGRLQHDCAFAIGEKIYSPARRQSTFFDPRGLPQSAQAHNNPDPRTATAINEVVSVYDGFGALARQVQEHFGAAVLSGPAASKFVDYEREGTAANQNRLARITYPSGRQYRLDYGPSEGLDDQLGRVVAIKEITPGGDVSLVSYDYLGMSVLVRKSYPEAEVALDLWGGTLGSYTGLDLFSRVVDQRWTGVSADAVRLQYGYDRGSRRTWRADLVAQSVGKNLDELYAFDGLSQIKSLRRGLLNAGHTDLESDTENFNEAWDYDAIGNWETYSQGNPAPALGQRRFHNTVNEIREFSNNPGPAWPKPRNDSTGNATRVPGANDPSIPFRVDYDAWNRPSRIATFDPSWHHIRVALHSYDARGWRVQSSNYVEGGDRYSTLADTVDFYFDNTWRCLEEWTTRAPTPPTETDPWIYYPSKFHERFLWDQAQGTYLDSLILRDRDTDGDEEADERFYAIQDAQFNIVAIAGNSGQVTERFQYSAFGTPTFFDADYEELLASIAGWKSLFACYTHDEWIGIYYVRNRYFHSRLGRWVNRDPIAEGGGINIYSYVGNNPLNASDPLGLKFTPQENKVTLAVLRSQPGVGSNWWGATYTDEKPKETGSDDIVETTRKTQPPCCAEVKSAKEFDLLAKSFIPTDGVGTEFTARARLDIWRHERRRVRAMRLGYNEYLAKAAGKEAKRCGQICKTNPGEAKAALQQYLTDLRADAVKQYESYNQKQQARITQENNFWVYSGPLADYYNIENEPEKPPAFKPPKCP